MALALIGCTACRSYDPRLNGTWRSNREESIVAAVKIDPAWKYASPAAIERFKDIFGQTTFSYSGNRVVCHHQGDEIRFRYKLIERGEDYDIIQIMDRFNRRIGFVDGGRAYWSYNTNNSGVDIPWEKFDKIPEPSGWSQ